MKRIAAALSLVLLLVSAPLVLWAATIRSANIVSSTINSTTIGQATPSTGAFTSITNTGIAVGNCVQVTAGNVEAAIPCPNGGRVTSGICSTTSSSYNICGPVTVNLSFSEPDTNYQVGCSGIGASGFPAVYQVSKSTGSVGVYLVNGTGNGATVSTFSEIDCVVSGS